MGIDIDSAKFLRSEVKRGLDLGNMLTLGHQAVYMDHESYRALIASLEVSCLEYFFADDFFHGLDAKSVDVMDVSNYEGANVLHNLNEPVGRELVEKYDCVFDGGALEHVFNLPQAFKNCMEMVKVGGHFIIIAPTNAYCGHGFYQFSPELFYSALSAENGYAVEKMLFVHREQWYAVRKPAEIRQRVELLTDEPTLLFITARRIERRPVFAQWPQQSDYVATWIGKQTAAKVSPKKSFKESVLSFVPFVRKLQTRWRIHKCRRECLPSNRARFAPVNLD
jgi:SAM-dependent methyltransferase